eukprot:4175019-Pleurochrysis_carterae.AAC.4
MAAASKPLGTAWAAAVGELWLGGGRRGAKRGVVGGWLGGEQRGPTLVGHVDLEASRDRANVQKVSASNY